MAYANKLYDFYIVATANGGAVLYQHAFIQTVIQITVDCSKDVISLNKNMPNKSESYF